MVQYQGGNLSTATTMPVGEDLSGRNKQRSILLVFCCTLLGAAAQVLIKSGANTLSQPTVFAAVLGMLTNVPLVAGYSLYGLSTLLLVLALRDGELSILYPVIALTYVWVSILSVVVFKETMSGFKAIGIALIVMGVAILGRGSRR